VALALTMLGRLVGIVTAAVALLDARVPVSVTDTDIVPPVCPFTVTTTGVPGGDSCWMPAA
jgi:hypothetical protein